MAMSCEVKRAAHPQSGPESEKDLLERDEREIENTEARALRTSTLQLQHVKKCHEK